MSAPTLYWSKSRKAKVPFGNEQCVFPKPSDAVVDPRGLEVGDRVCYWDSKWLTESKILHVNQPIRGKNTYQIGEITNNFTTKDWTDVGVFQPLNVSSRALGKIAEDKNLPEDIEKVIKKFGGRKRRSTLRKQKRRRTIKRR
jgi:hypothetical protein